ncbi:hypothetical protein QJQ45_008543 [Haematococcus lacustris]|nr:hypothetical protein QJQ45_008543 [Haematococcus lacustris]
MKRDWCCVTATTKTAAAPHCDIAPGIVFAGLHARRLAGSGLHSYTMPGAMSQCGAAAVFVVAVTQHQSRFIYIAYVRAGKAGEFLVQWEGYDASFNTWEPRANLTGCDKLLAEYNAIHSVDTNDICTDASLDICTAVDTNDICTDASLDICTAVDTNDICTDASLDICTAVDTNDICTAKHPSTSAQLSTQTTSAQMHPSTSAQPST